MFFPKILQREATFVTCYYEALQKWKEINLKKEFALKKVNYFTKRV